MMVNKRSNEPLDLGRYLYGRIEKVRDELQTWSGDAGPTVALMLDDILRSATARGGETGMPNPNLPEPEPASADELERLAEQTLQRPLTSNRVALASAYSSLALSKRLGDLTSFVNRSATFAPLPDQGEHEG